MKTPNASARSLSIRYSRVLGLILPLPYSEFFAELVHGTDEAAFDAGYNLMIATSHNDVDATLAGIHMMRGHVDAFLIVSPNIELHLETWLSATAAAGAYFEQSGNFDEALRAAYALIQEEPYRSQPYLLAGHLLVKQDRHAAAFQYFQAAEARRPSAEARRMMGHALLRGGRPADAVPYLQKSLAMDGTSEAALFDLAVAFAESRCYEEARGTADQLIRLNPNSDRARHLLARVVARQDSHPAVRP